jgi:hypothetical protein
VGRGVELGLLAGRLGEEELPHGTYHGRCRNQDSTSTRSSRRIHSNPRHPGAQITPNLQETPRIKTPAPVAWRDRRRDSEPKKARIPEGAGRPGKAAAAAWTSEARWSSRAGVGTRPAPTTDRSKRGKAGRHQSAARGEEGEGSGRAGADREVERETQRRRL